MATIAASISPWLAAKSRPYRSPSASLAFCGGSTRTSFSLTAAPPFLHCSSVFSSSLLTSRTPFSGRSVGLGSKCDIGQGYRRGFRLVVRAGKPALCLTKRNRSRKSLARTHGFRRRMRTTSGKAVLQRRRAKGRHVLCTKTNPNSGKSSYTKKGR